LGLGWWIAPHVLPVPLEAYIKAHFTKVGPQTRQLIAGYAAEARERGLPSGSLDALATAIGALPP
jgi:2-dehydropantoate 2-reductase